MGRSAAPVEPGTTPKPDTATPEGTVLGADEAAQVGEALTQAAVTETVLTDENKDLAATVAAMAARMRQQDAEIARLSANQRVLATNANPPPPELPTMDEALKNGIPAMPVLTKEGWYVPPILPTPQVR